MTDDGRRMSRRRQLIALLLGLVTGLLAGLLRRRPAPVPALDLEAQAGAEAEAVEPAGGELSDDAGEPDPDPTRCTTPKAERPGPSTFG